MNKLACRVMVIVAGMAVLGMIATLAGAQTPPAAFTLNDRFTHRPKEPIRPTYASDSTWRGWLVDDQRFAADRTDVLTYTSDVLTAPLRTRVNP